MESTINLGEKCGELPGGTEYASGYHGSLTIEVTALLSFGSGMKWGLRITKPKTTKTGRAGKPEHVFTLVANPDQSIPDLLRAVADMWDAGDVEVGQ